MNKLPFHESSFKSGKDRHHLLRREIERLNNTPGHIRVLEWGSGISTILMANTLKEDCSIISIEHSAEYLFDIPGQLEKKLTQIHLRAQKPYGQSAEYVTWPVTNYVACGQGYDLIIIDGRNRADCLAIAAMLIKPDGVVLLYDAEREIYHGHYRLFREIYIYPDADSCCQVALLKQPVCSLQAHDSLTNGSVAAIMPEREFSVPCSWGVCAVCLPRESYYWLKDWIDHHIKAGADKIAIYDNTGSVKSQRTTTPFVGGRLQREQRSKRGEQYGRLTAHLTDEQISAELREIAASYGERVEIIDWKPRHSKENVIVHGQVEAYCDFIRRHRKTLGWGLFIDLDEYIYCRPGLSVKGILESVEERHPSVSALHLTDWEFECRWSKDGPKDISKHLIHHPRQHSCGKILARLQDITHANVHWDWTLKNLCTRLKVHGDDMAFAHYMQLPENLADGNGHILPRAFLHSANDPSIEPRFIPRFHIDNCGVAALPVDTTFVTMMGESEN